MTTTTDPVIGIDLGTTNTCLATFVDGAPTVIPVRGQRTTPSVVALSAANAERRLVGGLAKRQLVTNPTGTVHSAKRIIGRPFHHPAVQQAKARLPYAIVAGPKGDARIALHDKVYAVPEIAAIVLADMKKAAEAFYERPVDKAVITVPAYFNDGQRQATKDAGRIAGLDVLRIISEPTAAALAYGFNTKKERTRVAVFDLGGGTFDISVLDIVGNTFEVVATAGDTYLGGDDFDQRIVDWAFQVMKKEHGVEPRGDTLVVQRVRDAAERAKMDLSSATSADLRLPFLYSVTRPDGRTTVNFDATLTRAALDDLTADLVRRTVDITKKMLEDARVPERTIDEVILVGGMTRMPAVRNAARDFFGKEPAWNVNPDEVVALGAAVQAQALVAVTAGTSGGPMRPDLLLLDVTPHNLGIMIAGGYFRTLIPANSTVPTSASHVFATVQDNQRTVKIAVLQGASQIAQDNELLGEFSFTDLPPGPRGSVQIDVTFDISAEGILFVSGTNLATGAAQTIEVSANDKLSEDELQRLIRENNRFAVEDRSGVDDAVAKVAALVDEVTRALPDAKRALAASGHDTALLQRADGFVEQARKAVASRDVAALEAARDQLARMKSLFDTLTSR